MGYIFTYMHPDKRKIEDNPAEFVGFVGIEDDDEALKKIKESMPDELKEKGYVVAMATMDDLQNWLFIVAMNQPLRLENLRKDSIAREFFSRKTECFAKG